MSAPLRQHVWPQAARDRVTSIWVTGEKTGAEIAAIITSEFGFPASKSSVIGIAFRAGLAFKGRQIKPCTRAVDRAAGRARQQAAREASRKRREAAKAATADGLSVTPPKAKAPPRPVAMRTEPVASLRIPLTEIREGQCRFIADDPSAAPATCCGHVTANASPWCEAHRAICTVRTGGKSSSTWVPRHIFRRAA